MRNLYGVTIEYGSDGRIEYGTSSSTARGAIINVLNKQEIKDILEHKESITVYVSMEKDTKD